MKRVSTRILGMRAGSLVACALLVISARPTDAGGYVAPVAQIEPVAAQLIADAGGPMARLLILCQSDPAGCAMLAGLSGLVALLDRDDDRPIDRCAVTRPDRPYWCDPGPDPVDPVEPDPGAVPLPAAGTALAAALAGLATWARRIRRRASVWADTHLDDMTPEERWLGRPPEDGEKSTDKKERA